VALERLGDRAGGHVALIGGQLDFSAKDPKEAYGPLVNTLIRLVTEDMRSTWTRQ